MNTMGHQEQGYRGCTPGPRFVSISLNQRGLRPRTPVGDTLNAGMRTPCVF